MYTVGARASKLSVAQTDWVISKLLEVNPGCDYKLRTITTKGDTDTRPLFAIDQRGIFEKEIDRAVAKGEVDFAVHSLKDVPSELDPSLIIASVPKREIVNDVFVSPDGLALGEIKEGAVIGTSSLRRAVQVSRKRPDVTVKPIRGNIETRIRKASEKEYDGIVIAQAGIMRLGVDVRFVTLPLDDFVPSPGQGAIAIVARSDDSETVSMLKKIQDSNSRLEIEAERLLSDYVDSGCRFPLGAYAKIKGAEMTLSVSAFSVDGRESLTICKTGSKDNSEALAKSVGEELRVRGIGDLALNWREKVEQWNKT